MFCFLGLEEHQPSILQIQPVALKCCSRWHFWTSAWGPCQLGHTELVSLWLCPGSFCQLWNLLAAWCSGSDRSAALLPLWLLTIQCLLHEQCLDNAHSLNCCISSGQALGTGSLTVVSFRKVAAWSSAELSNGSMGVHQVQEVLWHEAEMVWKHECFSPDQDSHWCSPELAACNNINWFGCSRAFSQYALMSMLWKSRDSAPPPVTHACNPTYWDVCR